ncbi:OmpA family protein, partial [Sulfuricella sp. T08]
YLTGNKAAKVAVQGNCDERGSREYNIALGNRRADSVRKVMNVMGASDSQIEVISFGEEKPRTTCHDESCWKENRRSDIVYQGE